MYAEEILKEIWDHINERYKDVIPDLRVHPPLEPRFLSLSQRDAVLESLRENIGFIKFSYTGLVLSYRDMLAALKEASEGQKVDWEKIVRRFLMEVDGMLHLMLTLSRNLDAIWRNLRSHHMWEILEEEKKRLRVEKMREARRRKREQKTAQEGES